MATVATLVAIVSAPTSPAQSGGSKRVTTSVIEGRWKCRRWTVHELVADGFTRKGADALTRRVNGTPAIDLGNGVFKAMTFETGRVISVGTYRVSGDVVRIIFRSGIGLQFGRPYALRWSVYRDRLTFSAVPGRTTLGVFTLHPWTRVS